MQRHLLAIAVILTVATGCDNVVWGGFEFELQPPPTSEDGAPVEEESVENGPPARALGPVLLAGVRDGPRATLALVGEITGDGLAPFPDPEYPEDSDRLSTLMSVGSEWILFSEGVRVGRLTADSVGTVEDTCVPKISVSGFVELLPDASAANRLLALSAAVARQHEFGEYRVLQRDYDQGVATLNIAGDVIPRVGAPWPDQGTLAARQDIQAIQMADMDGQAVAATFVHRDELAVGPAGEGAYAVFVLGVPSPEGYREAFSWYRSADVEGKGVPRYFGHLDWDFDGDSEILLDVLGSRQRWYAGLSQRPDGWTRTFQDACGSGPPSGE